MSWKLADMCRVQARIYSDDNSIAENNGFKLYLEMFERALEMVGRPQHTADTLRRNLESAGFVDIHVKSVKQPFGPWASDRRLKHVGAMVLLMAETGFEAYAMAPFTRVLGMSQEEAAKVILNSVISVKNKNTHMYSYL